MATTDSRIAIVDIDQMTAAQAAAAINTEIEALETAGFVVREQRTVSLGPDRNPKQFVLLLGLLAAHLDSAVAPPMQVASGTFVAGTATIAAGITVTADTDAFVIPSAVLTGSTNVGCPAHLKASNVVGGPGVGSVTLNVLGDDGAIDSDAAGDFAVLLVN